MRRPCLMIARFVLGWFARPDAIPVEKGQFDPCGIVEHDDSSSWVP
ncbi:hypothetical protein CEV32_4058 [Brucella rhizosphaerae]|uniref:Uncharacterized protein n=1 Tax=Brucella rhizosphaerae TaxID=571254 RepID=A0A256FQY3_9HYPH|nr:hypothetical protein CEV32_4058 [Brucella rhizosphaerae]